MSACCILDVPCDVWQHHIVSLPWLATSACARLSRACRELHTVLQGWEAFRTILEPAFLTSRRHGFETFLRVYLPRFTSITTLCLYLNPVFPDRALSCLTNLQSLDLRHNFVITDECLSTLTKLTRLDLLGNTSITHDAVTCLTRLRELRVRGSYILPTDVKWVSRIFE